MVQFLALQEGQNPLSEGQLIPKTSRGGVRMELPYQLDPVGTELPLGQVVTLVKLSLPLH